MEELSGGVKTLKKPLPMKAVSNSRPSSQSHLPSAKAANNGVTPIPVVKRSSFSVSSTPASSSSRPLSAASSSNSTSVDNQSDESDGEYVDELMVWIKGRLEPVNPYLKKLHELSHSEGGLKAHQLEVTQVLLKIGSKCDSLVREAKEAKANVAEQVEKHLWKFVSLRTRMTRQKLKRLYDVICRKNHSQTQQQQPSQQSKHPVKSPTEALSKLPLAINNQRTIPHQSTPTLSTTTTPKRISAAVTTSRSQ